jgi:hypothetical protein
MSDLELYEEDFYYEKNNLKKSDLKKKEKINNINNNNLKFLKKDGFNIKRKKDYIIITCNCSKFEILYK